MNSETPWQKTAATAEHVSGRVVLSVPPPASPSETSASVPVSFTTLIDFVAAKTLGRRQTVARKAAKQLDTKYRPQFDMYKEIREGIQTSGGRRIDLDLRGLSASKQKHYPMLQTGWNRFIGRKQFEAVQVKRKEWVGEGLVVRVNPEIALARNDLRTYYKLFFKTDDLTKDQVGIIYQMMHEMLIDEPTESLGLLHVRKGKVVPAPTLLPNSDLAEALRAEAAYLRRLLRPYLPLRFRS